MSTTDPKYVEDGYVEDGYFSDATPLPASKAQTGDVIYDSSSWTGKQLALVDAKVIAEIKRAANEMRSAVYSMHFQSNEESANLQGLADALVAVCEMAEPDVTIIDRIISSPKFQAYAGLLAFIATIRGALGF